MGALPIPIEGSDYLPARMINEYAYCPRLFFTGDFWRFRRDCWRACSKGRSGNTPSHDSMMMARVVWV